MDEPANHLDSCAREQIISALETFKGIGMVISHDRDLIDRLCSSTLFVRPGKIILRPGGYTSGRAQEELEERSAERGYETALERMERVEKSLRLLKRKEHGRTGSLSKKNIKKHDHDAKGKIDLARLTGKDKKASRKIKMVEKRAENLNSEAVSKYVKIRKTDGFTYNGERLRRDRIALIPAGKIYINEKRYIKIPEFVILPSDRISITGNNGTGKSTLMRYIRSMIAIPDNKVIYISQEISTDEWREIQSEIETLSGKDLGELLSVVYRLGSDPERILQTPIPSPGEIRKLILGLGLMKTPSLIMMDEPTNHMDMPSVECLENALSGFEGAVIIVSHDRRFINNTTRIGLHLVEKSSGSIIQVLY